MSRASYIVLAIFVLVASVAVVGWSFFGLGNSPSQPPSTQSPSSTSDQNAPLTESGGKSVTVPLPITLDNPVVSFASVRYGFVGNIVEIKEHPSGKLLITDIPIDPMYSFVVDKNTFVHYATGRQRQVATISALAAGQQVRIVGEYDLQTKVWRTESARIITRTPSPTTSSATR